MQMPSPNHFGSSVGRRSLALLATTAICVPAVSLAQTATSAEPVSAAALHVPADLSAAFANSATGPIAPAENASSSSSQGDMDPVAFMADPASPAGDGMGQPPPYRRRRYGRPTYSDRMHNADGSNRLAFVVGGGFNVPVGSASTNYLKTAWRFEGGAGINLSRKFGVLLQFDYDHFGLPGAVLTNQRALYNSFGAVDSNNNAIDFSSLDGNAHIWSFTLNPTFNFYQTEKVGAYAVVGGGFYHKVTNFTLPQEGVAYDYYYGHYSYLYQQTVDFYTSNAPGVTGGVGVTYKFSRFANERFFAEARYVHTFNKVRYGDPTYTGNSQGTAYNFYPPNSNETSYLPITVGVRF